MVAMGTLWLDIYGRVAERGREEGGNRGVACFDAGRQRGRAACIMPMKSNQRCFDVQPETGNVHLSS